MLYDGRGANKPWLLENADPVTKITWHSWVEVEPRDRAHARRARTARSCELTSPHGARRGAGRTSIPASAPTWSRCRSGSGTPRTGRSPKGRGANALDLLGAPAGDFVPLPLDPGHASRRPASYRKLATIEGVPRQLGRGHRRGDAAGGGAEGPDASSRRTSRKVTASTRSTPSASWRRSRAGREAPAPGAPVRRLRRASIPQWGMTIDLATLHRLPGLRHRVLRREQHPDGRRGGDPPRPRDDLDPDRAVLGGRRGARRAGRRRASSRCCASTATTRRASRSARCTPRTTPPTGSTARSTTAASAPATAPTTARTRCGTSTGTSTTSWPGPSRSTCSSTPT